jgi:hypothetical protein
LLCSARKSQRLTIQVNAAYYKRKSKGIKHTSVTVLRDYFPQVSPRLTRQDPPSWQPLPPTPAAEDADRTPTVLSVSAPLGHTGTAAENIMIIINNSAQTLQIIRYGTLLSYP